MVCGSLYALRYMLHILSNETQIGRYPHITRTLLHAQAQEQELHENYCVISIDKLVYAYYNGLIHAHVLRYRTSMRIPIYIYIYIYIFIHFCIHCNWRWNVSAFSIHALESNIAHSLANTQA